MKQIKIADNTICVVEKLGFKEKVGIARYLDSLGTDIVELPSVENKKEDVLLVKTISSFIKDGIISINGGRTTESIDDAFDALKSAKKGRIRIELPVSSVGMEYTLHKKGQKMLDYIGLLIGHAVSLVPDVEFVAVDATRAEADVLMECIRKAVESGAGTVTVSDDAGCMLPDEFAALVNGIAKEIPAEYGVNVSNGTGMAVASAALAVKGEAALVKSSIGDGNVPFEVFGDLLKNNGNSLGFKSNIRHTELHRTIKQITQIINGNRMENKSGSYAEDMSIHLDSSDDITAVKTAIKKLGYDLSVDDLKKVFEAFQRVSAKKTVVGAKELDAIIGSTALQVPQAYKIESYVINNGNVIGATAHIVMKKGESARSQGKTLHGVCAGDGPVDAAFLAIEQIIGRRFELDDFQIQSVTEGTEAVGSATVKLRANGKVYAGTGISTDIIGASIRAYINAVNKIIYEEK